MEIIIKKTEKLHAEILAEISHRDQITAARSMNWQDSDQGRAYAYDTEKLTGLANDLDEWIYNLRNDLDR